MSPFRRLFTQSVRALRQGSAPRRPVRPRLECLEDRTVPSTWTVINTADSGAGSLRQAILNANSDSGSPTIAFDIPGSGVHTIAPLSALPTLTNIQTTINGTTQPGYAGKPLIELSGASAGQANGLVTTASLTTIKGLDIDRFQYFGIALESSSDFVAACWIGVDNTGAAAAGNGFSGVFISGSACSVGGTASFLANVISANGYHGIQIQNGANNNTVTNNIIGLNAAGTAALGNGYDGVAIFGGAYKNNIVGTSFGGYPNVISGNDRANISISAPSSSNNVVAGNFIGTDPTGSSAITPTSLPATGSASGIGVWILGGATGNTIGGSASGSANTISGNAANGIQIDGTGTTGNIVEGNIIGLNAAGTSKLGNTNAGVVIESGATDNTIGGTIGPDGNTISGNGATGVQIIGTGTMSNTVECNTIGLPASGSNAAGNKYDGVSIYLGASDNTIGGVANTIAGNGRAGITLTSPGTTGNQIVTNLIGTQNNPNGTGVWIAGGAATNTIGGPIAAATNIISYNATVGVALTDSGTTANLVEGNLIGIDSTGSTAHANGTDGVLISNGASGNTIGGTASGAGNVISGNSGDGIEIQGTGTSNNLVAGNQIGTNSADTSAVPNANGVAVGLGASGNNVGSTAPLTANIISGNTDCGVLLADPGAGDNTVENDIIGLTTNDKALGNGFGILLNNGASYDNLTSNVVSANSDDIILEGTGTNNNILSGNWVGLGTNGTSAFASNIGILIELGASNNTVSGRNVIDTKTGLGIDLEFGSTTGNLIQGNIIGLNSAGNAVLGNQIGINTGNSATGNTIGGPGGDGNTISGNATGIQIAASNTTVEGNDIGTNLAGNAALGNGDGIFIDSSNNTIGGTAVGDENFVSGNTRFGIYCYGNTNIIEGNSIGGAPSGSVALGNGSHGIFLTASAAFNMIGGTAAADANTILDNGGAGVLIGSDPGKGFSSAAGIGNSVLGNAIYLNGGLGIDLGPDDGVTANGFNGNVGPNDYQDYPVLASATSLGNSTLIAGTLQGGANKTYRIEFFDDITADASGHGQGLTYLGYVDVYVAATSAAFSYALPMSLPSGRILSATATNLATGDTSEFAANIRVL